MPRGRNFIASDGVKREIARRYDEGETLTDLGAVYRCDYTTIRRIVLEMGVPLRRPGRGAHTSTEANRDRRLRQQTQKFAAALASAHPERRA